MVLYQYRCERHGDIEVLKPMGEAPRSVTCEVCGQSAKRVFTAPITRHPDRATVAAIDNALRSAHEPDVVTSIPSGVQKRPGWISTDPRHRKLPKPQY